MASDRESGGDGTTLRLSVTGHRDLADESSVESNVDAVLDRRLAGGRRPEVWSSLAEGADRLVTRRALQRAGAELIAVLPLLADDYERDFETQASRDDFRALLGRAVRHEVVGPDAGGSRESAYERAGRRVVESSDLLLALWDGEPSRGRGGTAEIIDYALGRDVEVEVLLVDRAGGRG